MMEIFKKYKKILIWFGVIIVVFVLYSMFFTKDDNLANGGIVSAPAADAQFTAGREIIALLTDLKALQLKDEVFQSNVFRSLEDFSLPVAPEPQGRQNPFAPIGVDTIDTVTKATTTVKAGQ
ncbi:MAG: hypothetical protein AAB769_00845 [Patescibacteria group bacterium]|mgnify:CR=1 FL=1